MYKYVINLCDQRLIHSLAMEYISPFRILLFRTFVLPSGLLADNEGTRGVDVSSNFFGAVLVMVVLDLFEVVVITSGWLDLKDDCCMSRIEPKSMVTGLSVLRSSCNFYMCA